MVTGSLFKRKPFHGTAPQSAEHHNETRNAEPATTGEEVHYHEQFNHEQEAASMNENHGQFGQGQEEEPVYDNQEYQTEQVQEGHIDNEVVNPFKKKTFAGLAKPAEGVVFSQPAAQVQPAQPTQVQPPMQSPVQPSAQPTVQPFVQPFVQPPMQPPVQPVAQPFVQPFGSIQVQPEIHFQPPVQPAVPQPQVQVQAPAAPQAAPSLSIQPQPVVTRKERKAPGTCPDGLIGLSVRIDPALYARLKMTAYRYNTKNAKVVEALIRDYCPES